VYICNIVGYCSSPNAVTKHYIAYYTHDEEYDDGDNDDDEDDDCNVDDDAIEYDCDDDLYYEFDDEEGVDE
jgi:hypothetical protein